MQLKNFNVYFFFIILLVVSVFAFFIFQPFLTAILLASVLAVLFQRLYNFFLRITKSRESVSALITSLSAILIFIIPFFIVLGLVINESLTVYENTFESGKAEQYVNNALGFIENNEVMRNLQLNSLFDREALGRSATQIGQTSIRFLQNAYQGVAHFVFISFVMFFALYYLLIDGKRVVSRIINLSPLKNEHEEKLIKKFISISRATIKGTLVVAFVQGAIGGIAFAMVGIPSAVIWGIIMTILSVIPIVGAFIVWLPAAIILLLTGQVTEAIFILLVGLFIISLIDNFLRPKLVGKDTQMHPLIVFFATLGGISVFGFLGFIIGPIVIALFLALWEIYGEEFKQQLDKFNA